MSRVAGQGTGLRKWKSIPRTSKTPGGPSIQRFKFLLGRLPKESFEGHPLAMFPIAGQAKPRPPVAGRGDAIYNRPDAHPQIRQIRGAGPIAHLRAGRLNRSPPRRTDRGAGENNELPTDARFGFRGWFCDLPVFALEMGRQISRLGLHELVPPRLSTGIFIFILSTPVVLVGGLGIFSNGAGRSVVYRA